MSAETWLPVVGLEGFAEVSDHGRVRSLDRITHVSASHYKPAYVRRHKGKLLKQARHPAGYMYITICGGGTVRRNTKVHHLVLEAFIGPCPEGMECCHANDIPDDNRLENLRWDTTQANARDRVVNGGSGRRTHCPWGHEYTPENTRILKDAYGSKRCKTCIRERYRKKAS